MAPPTGDAPARRWLCDPSCSIGFAGLAAVARDHGIATAALDDPARPAAGDLVASDPTRTPVDVVAGLERCHHVAVTHRRDEPFVLRTLRSGFLGFLLCSTPAEEAGWALGCLLRASRP